MSETTATEDRAIGEHVTLLGAVRGGKYPHGGSLLVKGSEEALLIDPSLSLVGRGSLPRVDRVLARRQMYSSARSATPIARMQWWMRPGPSRA